SSLPICCDRDLGPHHAQRRTQVFGLQSNPGGRCAMRTGKTLVFCVAALLIAGTARGGQSKNEGKELNQATATLTEIRKAPDNGTSEDMWNKAQCVVVIPSLKKAAFIVGGEFGDGVMSCRNASGWSAPVFMRLTKGSAGFQIGAQSTDLVLVVMNKSGAEKLL